MLINLLQLFGAFTCLYHSLTACALVVTISKSLNHSLTRFVQKHRFIDCLEIFPLAEQEQK